MMICPGAGLRRDVRSKARRPGRYPLSPAPV